MKQDEHLKVSLENETPETSGICSTSTSTTPSMIMSDSWIANQLENDHKFVVNNNSIFIHFSENNISCILESLEQNQNWQLMSIYINYVESKFLDRLEKSQSNNGPLHQSMMRAKAFLANSLQDTMLCQTILKETNFSSKHHTRLQKLWHGCHYDATERVRGRKLCAVDKYRIRKRNPLPSTIWDGEETIYCFKEKTRKLLIDAYFVNKYPNLEMKKFLARKSELTLTQVCNWFKNRRQRDRMQKNVTPSSTDPGPSTVYSNQKIDKSLKHLKFQNGQTCDYYNMLPQTTNQFKFPPYINNQEIPHLQTWVGDFSYNNYNYISPPFQTIPYTLYNPHCRYGQVMHVPNVSTNNNHTESTPAIKLENVTTTCINTPHCNEYLNYTYQDMKDCNFNDFHTNGTE